MEDNKKVTKMPHRVSMPRIEVILFICVFIYIIFHMVSYFSGKHIAVTEVKQGEIVTDNRFTALALRDETLVPSDASGEAYYYLPHESRVKKNETVVSLDKTGDLIREINNGTEDKLSLTDDQKQDITELLSSFNEAYSPDDFSSTYYLKQNASDYLALVKGEKVKKSLSKNIKSLVSDGSVTNVTAPEPGLLCLSYDNLNGLTEDTFTKDSFDESALKTTEVSTGDNLSDGDTAFRLVTSDNWQLVVPVSDSLADELKSEGAIEIRFEKDSTEVWATPHVVERDGDKYLVLDLDDSMDRFSDSRFLDIELLFDNESGLKVPNSSIVSNTKTSSDGGYQKTYGVYLANKGYTQYVEVKILYKNGQYSIIEPVRGNALNLYDYIVLDASKVKDGELINN
ncbi:MAG: HlyD family efflux transporter periplasmic adaptor subunit [Candidatus Weimeria sp.]